MNQRNIEINTRNSQNTFLIINPNKISPISKKDAYEAIEDCCQKCNKNMFCCCPSNIPRDATLQLTKLTRILLVLAFVQMVFAVLSFWIGIVPGMYCVIGGITLLMITQCRNFCGCICYVFISLIDGVFTFSECGKNMARDGGLKTQTDVISFILLLKLVFYMVSIYYTFLAYRELKALFLDPSMAANTPSMLMPGMGFGGAQGARQNLVDDRPQPPQNQPFTGQGHRLG